MSTIRCLSTWSPYKAALDLEPQHSNRGDHNLFICDNDAKAKGEVRRRQVSPRVSGTLYATTAPHLRA